MHKLTSVNSGYQVTSDNSYLFSIHTVNNLVLNLWNDFSFSSRNGRLFGVGYSVKFRAISSWGAAPKISFDRTTCLIFIVIKKVIEWVHGQADGYNKDLKIISDSLMQKDSKVGQMKGSNKKSKVNDMYKTIDTVFIDMIML